MDLTAKTQQPKPNSNDGRASKESDEGILEKGCPDNTQPDKLFMHTFRKDPECQTAISACQNQTLWPNLGSCLPLHRCLCLYLSSKWRESPQEYTRDSHLTSSSFSTVDSLVNSESTSDMHTVKYTGWLCSSFADASKQEVGQEMDFLMSTLVCNDVTNGQDQTLKYLADTVLKVELWDIGSGTRRCMAKWQLTEGSTLLAEDVWLSGVNE